jgi:hypothetical protein
MSPIGLNTAQPVSQVLREYQRNGQRRLFRVPCIMRASIGRPIVVRSPFAPSRRASLLQHMSCAPALPSFFFANPCPAHRSFIITSPSCCQLLLMMGDHLLLNEFPNHQFTGYQLDSWGEEVLSIRSCSSGVRQIGLTRILRTFS